MEVLINILCDFILSRTPGYAYPYFHRTGVIPKVSWVKKIWNALEEEKDYRFIISLVAFIIAVVPGSIAVCFASILRNEFFLSLIVIFSATTLALCIGGAPLKIILLNGIFSFISSVSAIIYTLIAHKDLLERYF